jgi:hypothetical protein
LYGSNYIHAIDSGNTTCPLADLACAYIADADDNNNTETDDHSGLSPGIRRARNPVQAAGATIAHQRQTS